MKDKADIAGLGLAYLGIVIISWLMMFHNSWLCMLKEACVGWC